MYRVRIHSGCRGPGRVIGGHRTTTRPGPRAAGGGGATQTGEKIDRDTVATDGECTVGPCEQAGIDSDRYRGGGLNTGGRAIHRVHIKARCIGRRVECSRVRASGSAPGTTCRRRTTKCSEQGGGRTIGAEGQCPVGAGVRGCYQRNGDGGHIHWAWGSTRYRVCIYPGWIGSRVECPGMGRTSGPGP